jgi:hypothetical protein
MPVYARFTEGFGAPVLRAAKALLGGPLSQPLLRPQASN